MRKEAIEILLKLARKETELIEAATDHMKDMRKRALVSNPDSKLYKEWIEENTKTIINLSAIISELNAIKSFEFPTDEEIAKKVGDYLACDQDQVEEGINWAIKQIKSKLP